MTSTINRKQSEKGFTLIELMIVVAIIGILAAIAIPQFSSYRERAFNSAAESDLRNIMNGEEAYYADNQIYGDVAAVTGPANAFGSLDGVKISTNVKAQVASSTASDYTATAEHKNGSKTYTGGAASAITSTSKTVGSYSF